MKTVPASLQTLIEKQVTTLAYMWIFTRRDGVTLHLTDHDRAILFNGEFYEALSGFTRSALAAKADLSVDNTDAEAIYDSDSITEEDLRKGLWDYAEFEFFLIDWTTVDTTDRILLRKGTLGQMVLKDTNFTVEQRGLTQALSVISGAVYSPLCRVDLFSTDCGLTAATWAQQSSVTSLTNRRRFVAEAKLKVQDEPAFTTAEAAEVSISATTGYATWDEATPDGTAAHPYQISTPAGVHAIRNDLTAYYVLTQNVDMTPWGNFTPIQGFQGDLDGRGFEIQNLDLDDSTTVYDWFSGDGAWGLFGTIGENGYIRRLGLKDPEVDIGVGSTTYLGAMFGLCLGRIEDCWVEGGSVTVDHNFYASGGFGGLLRRTESLDGRLTPGPWTRGTVKNCWAATQLIGVVSGGRSGFIGTVTGKAQPLETGCYFDSTVAGSTHTGNGDQATPLTTAQAIQSANYPEYDFANDWLADDGVDYPRHLDPGRGNGTNPYLRFPATLLTFAGLYSTSEINWTADEPGTSSITVESSRDGESWSACTSGAAIPGFTPGENLAGDYVTIRVNFIEDGTNLPTLETLDFSITGQTNAFDADALGSNDWFKAGHVKWLTGLNAGVAMEVKSWNAASKEIVLFLEMPFDIVVGDSFSIYPGCAKRILDDCRDKFSNVVNFRGEPNVPGSDQLLKVPDAPA